tara:strand:+ start:416 stop:616 length:201 start_codon:yes stop_codon:yes gene_type:complete
MVVQVVVQEYLILVVLFQVEQEIHLPHPHLRVDLKETVVDPMVQVKQELVVAEQELQCLKALLVVE